MVEGKTFGYLSSTLLLCLLSVCFCVSYFLSINFEWFPLFSVPYSANSPLFLFCFRLFLSMSLFLCFFCIYPLCFFLVASLFLSILFLFFLLSLSPPVCQSFFFTLPHFLPRSLTTQTIFPAFNITRSRSVWFIPAEVNGMEGWNGTQVHVLHHCTERGEWEGGGWGGQGRTFHLLLKFEHKTFLTITLTIKKIGDEKKMSCSFM